MVIFSLLGARRRAVSLPPADGLGGYVFATFSTAQPKAYVYVSQNGINYQTIPRMVPYTDPDPAYVIRDPTVVRVGDHFVMAYTRALASNQFGGPYTSWGLAQSSDLRSWTHVVTVTPGIPDTTVIWAPDLMFTNTTLYVYWALNGGDGGMYVQSATISDLTVWSDPTFVQGFTLPVIDLNVIPYQDRYLGIIKDEGLMGNHYAAPGYGDLFVVWADSPLGPFTYADNIRLPISGYAEGPYLVPLPDGMLRLYFDRFMGAGWAYMDTTDLVTWTAPQYVTVPSGAPHSHRSVVPITEAEYVALIV